MFALSKCWDTACLRIFGGEGASPDGYVNECRDFSFFKLNPLIDKNRILQRVSGPMALVEVCAL